MRVVFVADAHLQSPEDSSYRKMLRFLDELCGNTSTLYIMGDFFEFWIGYPENPFSHYQPVLDALQRLRACGTDIIYFEGNHDFHMGPFFTETLGAVVNQGPASYTINDRRYHLCHGDQANPADIPYRILRGVLHSPVTRWLTHIVPPGIASLLAERMGRKGRTNLHLKGENPACRRILREFAAKRFAEGYETVIAGHFHLPFIEESEAFPGKLLVSLGDWATRLSFTELVDGSISQKTYN